MRSGWFIIFLFFIAFYSHAKKAPLPKTESISIVRIADILQPEKSVLIQDTIFINNNNNGEHIFPFNFKLNSDKNQIICILKNTDTAQVEAIIELTNPFLKKIKFYTVDSNAVVDSVITGSEFIYSHRAKSHPNFQYPVVIPAYKTITCIVDIDVGNTSGDFKLIVWNKEYRNDYQVIETKYLSYFFIINISFLFLLGFAILMTRQRYHWYYYIYALFGFIYIYAEVGLGYKNIWPTHPNLQNNCVLLIANIYQVFGLLFVEKYFNTKLRLPFLHKMLTILIFVGLTFEALSIVCTFRNIILPSWMVLSNTIIFLISGLMVFAIAASSVKFKNLRSDAVWFMVGFTPHAISILQLCLRPFSLFTNEGWFKKMTPVYLDTLHPPNFLFWSVLWEVIVVFILLIRRLKRLYEENNTMTEQLSFQREKNMTTLLSGVEQERQRIAQELHDGSGVALSALKMKLNVLKENIDSSKAENNIGALMKDVDRIYEEIRGISHNLMPKTLSKLGLYPAIDELINQFRIAAPQIKFNYYRKGNVPVLAENAKINIFRIVQELLTNVVKHSNAKEVSLQLIKHNNSLMISIEDDGTGFDTREAKKGIGLTSVESRVQILNGNLSIDTAPQNGTFISIFLPIISLN